MLTRSVKLFAIIVLLLSVLTGCWDSLDVNKRNITTAILLDYKDDEYHFYMEVATVQKSALGGAGQGGIMGGQSQGGQGGGTSENRVDILRSSGKSLAGTRIELDHKADNPIYLSTVRTMIISDSFAQMGIERWMNRIRELRDYRQTMHCVTSSSDPVKLLKATTANAPSTGFGINQLLMNLYDNGRIMHISSEDILEKIAEEYTVTAAA